MGNETKLIILWYSRCSSVCMQVDFWYLLKTHDSLSYIFSLLLTFLSLLCMLMLLVASFIRWHLSKHHYFHRRNIERFVVLCWSIPVRPSFSLATKYNTGSYPDAPWLSDLFPRLEMGLPNLLDDIYPTFWMTWVGWMYFSLSNYGKINKSR